MIDQEGACGLSGPGFVGSENTIWNLMKLLTAKC